MNTTSCRSISSEDVSQYLLANPDFFVQHPDVLRDIQVPHVSGEAVSLVEKQLLLLRHQHTEAQDKFNELVEIARQNEELARRMHLLSLTLIDATEPKEIFSVLYKNLQQNFKVDHVTVKLFAELASSSNHLVEEFVGNAVSEKVLFDSIIQKRMPVSGHIKHQQRTFLFGESENDIASAVIVPLHGKGWGGVLSIASTDLDRFTQTMGVELLANLGEILSLILKPWIVEDKSF